jgi:23S rRNA (cytosine1962-C5)-methyltransferase
VASERLQRSFGGIVTYKIHLKKNEEERALAGHLWVFSNEIGSIEGKPAMGETAELYDSHNAYLGLGFYNPKSLIAFRLLSRGHEDPSKEFWEKRLRAALALRVKAYPGMDSFRAVFGESDMLPGLIVDKYGKYLAVQFLSAGLEKNRDDIVAALVEVFKPAGIIARNDSGLRALEGLEEKIETLMGEIPDDIEIEENGLRFGVKLKSGQKTGFYFDQRDNRKALAPLCGGKELLDIFCHTGGFGVYAAKAGAKSVTFVDSSGPALETAVLNAKLNGVCELTTAVEADASKYLEEQGRTRKKFGIINLDPPALIKNKKSFFAGVRLYSKLNAQAMALLEPGGILATSSCSHNLQREDFLKMLREAGGKAGKQFRTLELRGQSKDHPVLLSMPETEYLKFAILEMI